ncbi:pyridoxamine 5'-phosphate oxidase family protein [Mycolicibacterium sp. 050232]|uniref:pyridoxamine 5'-phosphate oxidase family protein n=1 Tax=Mycolicibacterium sp. 050232 TaxID=3113982 RepID=UPI002E29C843|nr:pyridoxamine 5'-phosphate oxidase family protein [Mycolicibacterium sp. 050232]MED5811216.1 pyridoxamine 5'-phosphate oxidase family protein [Mycolicibacterium sp. 050232]
MALFTEKEIEYLSQQHIGRLATSGKTALPHVVPTGFHVDAETGNIKIGGHAYRGQDRLYIRHLKGNPQAAFVVDDLVTEPTWSPRGVSIKGPVTIHDTGGEALGPGFGPRWIEITPHWVSSWGINEEPFAEPVPPRKVSG